MEGAGALVESLGGVGQGVGPSGSEAVGEAGEVGIDSPDVDGLQGPAPVGGDDDAVGVGFAIGRGPGVAVYFFGLYPLFFGAKNLYRSVKTSVRWARASPMATVPRVPPKAPPPAKSRNTMGPCKKETAKTRHTQKLPHPVAGKKLVS